MKTSLKGVRKFWSLLRQVAKNSHIKRRMINNEVRLFDKNGHEYCPMTACGLKLGEKDLDLGQTNVVRDLLNMDETYERMIIDAADDAAMTKSEKALRRKLLKTLHLKEVSNDD